MEQLKDMLSPREQFAKEIKEKIIAGKLKIGERLPTERDLEAETGINKSAIHLALKDLEHAGFLKVVPRHGVFVADYAKNGTIETFFEILKCSGANMNRKHINDLVDLRNAVEGGALIALAARHTENDINVLRQKVENLRNAIGQNLNVEELGMLGKDFHYTVCDLSGNEMFILLTKMCDSLAKEIWERCISFWGIEGCIRQDEHVIELIEQGKGIEAQAYITEVFEEYLKLHGFQR